MTDRIAEIRARLDAWKRQTDAMEAWDKLPRADRPKYGYHVAAACGCGDQRCGTSDEWYPVWYHEGEVYEHAPADIAWLLDRVRDLEAGVRSACMIGIGASGATGQALTSLMHDLNVPEADDA